MLNALEQTSHLLLELVGNKQNESAVLLGRFHMWTYLYVLAVATATKKKKAVSVPSSFSLLQTVLVCFHFLKET